MSRSSSRSYDVLVGRALLILHATREREASHLIDDHVRYFFQVGAVRRLGYGRKWKRDSLRYMQFRVSHPILGLHSTPYSNSTSTRLSLALPPASFHVTSPLDPSPALFHALRLSSQHMSQHCPDTCPWSLFLCTSEVQSRVDDNDISTQPPQLTLNSLIPSWLSNSVLTLRRLAGFKNITGLDRWMMESSKRGFKV